MLVLHLPQAIVYATVAQVLKVVIVPNDNTESKRRQI